MQDGVLVILLNEKQRGEIKKNLALRMQVIICDCPFKTILPNNDCVNYTLFCISSSQSTPTFCT